MNAADQMIRRVVAQAVDLLDRGGGGRAATVTLIATSGGHLTEGGLQREFESLAAGTPLEGARLRFRWQAVRYRCGACLHGFRSVEPLEAVRCPGCGGTALPLGQVGTVGLQSIEVARPTGADRLLHPAGLGR